MAAASVGGSDFGPIFQDSTSDRRVDDGARRVFARSAILAVVVLAAVAAALAACATTAAARSRPASTVVLAQRLAQAVAGLKPARPFAPIAQTSARRRTGTTFESGWIASTALTYVGEWGGTACRDAQRSGLTGSARAYPAEPRRTKAGSVTKRGDGQPRAFVACVVWFVSGHTRWIGGGNDVFAGLVRSGREIKTTSRLAPGDVVQMRNGRAMIIASRVRGNLFQVVSSNDDGKENVGEANRRLALGPDIRAFRFGLASKPVPAQDVNNPDAYDRQLVAELVAFSQKEKAEVDALEPDIEAKVKALDDAGIACLGSDTGGQLTAAFLTLAVSLYNIPRWYPELLSTDARTHRSMHPHQPVLAEALRLSEHIDDAFLLIGGPPIQPADMCRIAKALEAYANANPNATEDEAVLWWLELIGVTDYNARTFIAETNALTAASDAIAPQLQTFFTAAGYPPDTSGGG